MKLVVSIKLFVGTPVFCNRNGTNLGAPVLPLLAVLKMNGTVSKFIFSNNS